MPIYEYSCSTCGTNFETQHKMNDSPPAHAPDCSRGDCKIEKQMTAFASVIKSPNPLACSVAKLKDTFPYCQTPPTKQESAHTCRPGCAMHTH